MSEFLPDEFKNDKKDNYPKKYIESEPETEVRENNFNVESLLASAGTLEINDKQKGILFSPPNEEDIEIRPDGMIYLPWMEYERRLNDAFGTSWVLIPQGMPKKNGNFILWGFYLLIKGIYCGFAIGEQQYHPNNPIMTWGDACEGAKSNALMRLCKNMGITIELWKPSFIRDWISKNAVKYEGKDKYGNNKIFWKKKNDITEPNMSNEDIITSTEKNETTEKEKITDKQIKAIHLLFGRSGLINFKPIFKEYCIDCGWLEKDQSTKQILKEVAIEIIGNFTEIEYDFYSKSKYHKELKTVFKQLKNDSKIKILMNLTGFIEEINRLPKKIEGMEDKMLNDTFSLFLVTINNQRHNEVVDNSEKNGLTTEQTINELQELGMDPKVEEKIYYKKEGTDFLD